MAKETTLKEMQQLITDLQANRAAELEKIQEKKEEAQAQKEAAEAAIKEATKQMDLEAYEEARKAASKAQTAIEMYASRYKQIQEQEYISENESDSLIDGLLEYEKKRTLDFEGALAKHMKELDLLLDGYLNEQQAIKNTLTVWQEQIKKNYRTMGMTIYVDRETGQKSDKSKTPIDILKFANVGSEQAQGLRDFLEKKKGFYKG